MPTLHIARGIQASGKTSFAKAWAAEDPEHRARVNRDDLRTLLHGGYVKEIERRVIYARDALISTLLAAGADVFCDDTNLPSRTVRDLMKVAANANAAFQVHDFTDVPIEVCVERDAARREPVGEQVIRDTWTRFIKGRALPLPLPEDADDDREPLTLYEAKAGTPQAVMVDVDGTVALLAGRSPFDESRVIEDLPNRPVIDVVRALHAAGHRIVVMSGRTTACRAATVGWLNLHLGVPFDGPFMREEGDVRKDAIVKAELFDKHVRDAYDVSRSGPRGQQALVAGLANQPAHVVGGVNESDRLGDLVRVLASRCRPHDRRLEILGRITQSLGGLLKIGSDVVVHPIKALMISHQQHASTIRNLNKH